MAHWLLKSEPSAYSWDQLVKEKQTSWTGVRNAQAAINLKAMKAGERCFFYHSGEGKEIVGIAEVVKAAYPDPTDKAGKAVTVDIKAVQPVKQAGDAGRHQGRPGVQGVQAGAPVAALSVVPVSDEHWKLLLKMSGTK